MRDSESILSFVLSYGCLVLYFILICRLLFSSSLIFISEKIIGLDTLGRIICACDSILSNVLP